MTRFTTTGRSNPWSYDTPRSFKPMRPTYLADEDEWPMWLKVLVSVAAVVAVAVLMGGVR